MGINLFKKLSHQPWFGGGVGAALAAVIGMSMLFFSFGNGLQDWSYDLPFLFRAAKSVDNINIIYLDEESYHDLKQDPSEFDRSLHAQLLKRLQTDGAKLAVFDMLFIDASRPLTAADQKFAEAMHTFDKVVIGSQVHYDNHLGGDNLTLVPPIDLFRDSAAGWGVAQIARDADFSARKHHPGTEQVPSLAWKAATLANAEVTKHPEKRGDARWLNYYSPEPFEGFSYSKVLSNNLPTGFSFKDKYVFIGSGEVAGFTGEEKEQFRYPWTWQSGHFPVGVEIHALTFANLLRHDWLTRWPTIVEVLLLGITGVLLGYGLSLLRPLAASGIALAAAILIAALALLLMSQLDVWFPWMIVVAVQIPIGLAWSFLFHSIQSYLETKLLQVSLGLYVSPKQVEQILRRPDLLKPGATQKTVSILFSDIASFSKISERMDPEDLVKLLNNYYETAIACVHQTDGTVINLIGDAILAVWNAPQDQEDHRERAANAALLLNEKLFYFDSASTSLPLRTRVGLHSGAACVGNIGSSTHFDYTAIGESVNMASRLEGLNKYLGTHILATREIQKMVKDKLVTRFVGHFRFKGFDQVAEVHEMIGPWAMLEITQQWRDAFAEGIRCFQRKNFTEAEKSFQEVLKLSQEDGPSKFYLERIAGLRANPPPADWVGEIDLRDK